MIYSLSGTIRTKQPNFVVLEVSGVGEHKFEKYGARFLQRIAEHV